MQNTTSIQAGERTQTNEEARAKAFTEFQAECAKLTKRGKRLTDSIHDRGWKIAANAGIDRNLCCLHNASIDDAMRGWCAGSPERLKAAKRAVAIVDDWSASRLVEILTAKLWNRLLGPHGYATYTSERTAPTINRHLLFSRP